MNNFYPGSFYVFDCVNPWGTDKFCLQCAEMHFGSIDDEDDEYSEDKEDITMPDPLHADGGTYDATGWQSWPPVESGDWGLVYVTRGHLGGRFVYYDDDEGEDEAIVYTGGAAHECLLLCAPHFATPAALCRHPSLGLGCARQ